MKPEKPYRVWWIPQVPMEAFTADVDTLAEARTLVRVLADYDRFQYEHRVKPDYCNVGGIMTWDGDLGDWCDWCDMDEEEENDT